MGRRAKPDALKVAQGNPGKRKIKAMRTAFTAEPPEEFPAPAHLNDREKLIWRTEIKRVGNLNLLRQSDMSAFKIYVETIKRYEDCKKVIDEQGMTYQVESKHGSYSRKRPEVDIERECRRYIRDMQREFGMTSISRIRAHMVVAATRPEQPALPLQGGGDGKLGTTETISSPLGVLRMAGHA